MGRSVGWQLTSDLKEEEVIFLASKGDGKHASNSYQDLDASLSANSSAPDPLPSPLSPRCMGINSFRAVLALHMYMADDWLATEFSRLAALSLAQAAPA